MNIYHQLIDRFAHTRLGGWMTVTVFSHTDRWVMRLTSGALSTGLGTDFHDNIVLLCCTGAKSGQLRQIPLFATPLGEQYILIASNGGRTKHPAWYHNLMEHPNCALIIRRRGEIAYIAHEAKGTERIQAWAAANDQFSGYNAYQSRITRQFPVMILTPRS